MNAPRCDFCGCVFTRPPYHRYPTGACSWCSFQIHAKAAQPQPDLDAEIKKNSGYFEAASHGWMAQ